MKDKNIIKNQIGKEALGWIFNAPYLIYSLIFFLVPLIWAFWLATNEWNLMSSNKKFVGMNNFLKAFKDEKIKMAFLNSFKYLVTLLILIFICSFIIAILVHELPEKMKGVVAVLFFIPYLTSGVATAVVVKYIFNYNSVLNKFLRENFNKNIEWFQNAHYAFWIMIFIVVWKMSGYYALFILSSLESIPEEVNDACKIDGADGLIKLIKVTIPMIMPTLTTVIVLAAGLAFGIFTEPYLLTGGGPSLATTTWQLEIYNVSFVKFQSGYGAAISILNAVQIFITIRIISYFMNKLNKKFGW